MDATIPLLKLSLFGPWQLHHSTIVKAKEPRRKEQALLAYLALESEQPHSRDSLVGLFWPDLPNAQARNNLRVALSRLKQYLGQDALLETTRYTVSFCPKPYFWLDVVSFLQSSQHPEKHTHDTLQRCEECQVALKQAMSLYQGEFMSGFYLEDCLAFEEWLFIWRERLHLQMLRVLEQLNHSAEQSQHYEDAAGYARHQLELNALHEPAHRQLMRALMGQGQANAALAHYQSCAELLQDELGVQPDVETQQLAQSIEADTFTLTSSQNKITRQLFHLPENTTPFIGREMELEQLSRRLRDQQYRLISLVGPGGIGKTRLAIEAARSQRDVFRDGIVFIPLEGVQRATEISPAVAEAMGMTLNGTEEPQAQIINILRDKQLMLVIDNLEHV
ncbi:MAG: BTAD domain-containing putative transcriptional regulator, partial [Chloroflexota bacterium]